MKFSVTSHPGSGYVYVICDVCGRKVRRQDTVKITDRWNLQNGMVVCKEDVDKVNEQNKPLRISEKLITNPETLRSEPSDRYATPTTDDRAPGAPQNLEARASTLGDDIELFWRGPEDVGTSQITGYKIERAVMPFTSFTVVDSNTGSENTYYKDTSADTAEIYFYRVSAINGAGVGTASPGAFYPSHPQEILLGVSQSSEILATSLGDEIKLWP